MANKIYGVLETTKFFVPAAAAQAEDAAFEVHFLQTGTGIWSANLDLGVSAVARWFEWRAWCQFGEVPVLDEHVGIYLNTSGNSASATLHPSDDDGYATAIATVNKLKNQIGSIVVDEAAINIEMVASGLILLKARAVAVGFWNHTADDLTNDVDENGFSLTPVPDEIQ